MYQRLCNISEENILRSDTLSDIKQLPTGSNIIILDDLSTSGCCLKQAASYDRNAFLLPKDRQILFCPLVAHSEAINKIEEVIQLNKRSGIDTVLTLKKNVKDRDMSTGAVACDEYFYQTELGKNILGYEGFNGEFGPTSSCTVFPYMTPDNNADLASFITKYFLPNENAMSNRHMDFFKVDFELKDLLKNLNKTSKD